MLSAQPTSHLATDTAKATAAWCGGPGHRNAKAIFRAAKHPRRGSSRAQCSPLSNQPVGLLRLPAGTPVGPIDWLWFNRKRASSRPPSSSQKTRLRLAAQPRRPNRPHTSPPGQPEMAVPMELISPSSNQTREDPSIWIEIPILLGIMLACR